MTCTRRGAVCLLALLAVAPVPTRAADDAATALTPWWTLEQFDGNSEVEDKILAMVNTERERHKLARVALCTELVVGARQHSAEMLKEGYFAHESPHAEWRMPAQRAYRSGYWEAFVAENIINLHTGGGAAMTNAQLAELFMYSEHGWMNSPGHRANILNPDYTEIGVGVTSAGGRYYGTQLFGRRYYETFKLQLRVVGRTWELSGQAKVVSETDRVYVGLDRNDQILSRHAVKLGDTLPFRVSIPLDGQKHRVGLHPGSTENRYWLKWLLFLDTAKPLDQALTMPFEPGR